MPDRSMIEDLLESCGVEGRVPGVFSPGIGYFSAMDTLIYLSEDCSYRVKRIDDVLSLLIHPQEDRVVGMKIEGTSSVMKTPA